VPGQHRDHGVGVDRDAGQVWARARADVDVDGVTRFGVGDHAVSDLQLFGDGGGNGGS